MNKLLLDDLQRRSVYPSVTILVTTTPDIRLSPGERASVAAYIDDADRRLRDDSGTPPREPQASRSRVISSRVEAPTRAMVRSSSAHTCSITAWAPSAPASARP